MMFNFLKRISTMRTFWIVLAALVILIILFDFVKLPEVLAHAMGYAGNLDVWAIDTSINLPPATIYGFLTSYGDAGRSAVVVVHLVFDYVYPVVYSLFFSISLMLVGQHLFHSSGLWRWLTLLPFLGGLSDFLENAGIITIALNYPTQLTLVTSITSIFTILKFSFIIVSILLLLIGVSVLLARWVISIPLRGTRSKGC